MYIRRAHRIGSMKTGRARRRGAISARQSEQEHHRPIIAGFRDYKDIESILANGRMLRGKEVGINRDYPKKIIAARARLWSDYKTLKSRYPENKVTITFPAKLIWNGSVKREEFSKGDNLDLGQPNFMMQAPAPRLPTSQQPFQPSRSGTPGPNIQPSAEPLDEARNLVTLKSKPEIIDRSLPTEKKGR